MDIDLRVNWEIAKELQKACNEGISDCGRGEVIFDEEAVFPDGNRFAIQVIAPEEKGETAWTQGVLFSPNGQELGHTEVGENFLGEYCIENYTVIVKNL